MKTDNSAHHSTDDASSRSVRPLWLRILKWAGVSVLAVILLVIAVLTLAVWILSPERLTPLVEEVADEALDARLSVDRVEISFWHTFPRLELEIDNLTIKSNALTGLFSEIRGNLPTYADSLLSIGSFSGSVNIPKLLVGKIALYDITLDSPRVNIIQATPEVSNIDIFPPTSDTSSDNSPVSLPDISIGTFEIVGGMPIRYVSLPDSVDVALTLTSTLLEGKASPCYSLDMKGLTDARVGDISLDNLSFGFGGNIGWAHENPYALSLDDFRIGLGKVSARLSADIDFAHALELKSLAFNLPLTPASDFLALVPEHIPTELSEILSRLKADFSLKLDATLTRPWFPATDSLPSIRVDLTIPMGKVSYEQFILQNLSLILSADIDGKDLDRSTVTLSKFLAVGQGVGFEFTGTFTDLLSDPAAEGTFRGGLEIKRLPASLLAMLPCKVDGSLRADSRFSLRKSDLDKDNFHRIRLSGDATLRNFTLSMPELPADIYARNTELRFGTNSSFTRGTVSVDSLLTASLKIDTIAASITGVDLRAGGIRMGVGCLNTAASADTSIINPIGARIEAERITYRSTEDSMRIRLRRPTVGATVRRFKGDRHRPQLSMNIATEGAFYADRVNRALLSNAQVSVTAYPSASTSSSSRNSRLTDSIAALHPELSADSVRALAAEIRQARRRATAATDSSAIASGEVIDLTVDNSLRRLMRRWDATGHITADRLRLFTPYFPLRNTLTDLNVSFTSDSLAISDTRFRAGHTSLVVNGSISNITRALTSRNHSQPLRLDFSLAGDTVEVNEIAAAVFAGAAFADSDTTGLIIMTDNENENDLQASVESGTATDSMATLVIPSNIEATLRVSASHIAYSNLMFKDFKGNLNIGRGALNLEQLSARTSVGSLNLNALYSAPSRNNASFAFGMKVKDFHVRQFLDLVPAIDSLMPLLYDIDGVINADLAATTRIDDGMNINIPSLKAAVKLSGDSLVLIDQETFRKIGKWLLFKHKDRNVIDRMSVEMIVSDSRLELFPFIFDIDRYKLGVMGTNDLAMNLRYHIAVLKSPLPFKFGINISGNVDDMKIRLGRAKFNEKNLPASVAIADTTRINLVREIGNIFRRGIDNASVDPLDFSSVATSSSSEIRNADTGLDTISHADSAYFIQQGLIAPPDTVTPVPSTPPTKSKKSSSKKKSRK